MSLIDRGMSQEEIIKKERKSTKVSQVVPLNMPVVTEEQCPDFDAIPSNIYDYEEEVVAEFANDEDS